MSTRKNRALGNESALTLDFIFQHYPQCGLSISETDERDELLSNTPTSVNDREKQRREENTGKYRGKYA